MSRRVECLYTKQKLKKKKTWSDGMLVASIAGSQVCLYDAASTSLPLGNPLETRVLSKFEKESLFQGKYIDIEFENYLVTVEESVKQPQTITQSVQNNSTISKLTFSKFKVPKTVLKPLSPLQGVKQSENCVSDAGCKRGRGAYQVDDEELNNIWSESPLSKRQTVKNERPSQLASQNQIYKQIPPNDFNYSLHSAPLSPSNNDVWGYTSPIRAPSIASQKVYNASVSNQGASESHLISSSLNYSLNSNRYGNNSISPKQNMSSEIQIMTNKKQIVHGSSSKVMDCKDFQITSEATDSNLIFKKQSSESVPKDRDDSLSVWVF